MGRAWKGAAAPRHVAGRSLLLATMAVAAMAGQSHAQGCATLPYGLSNGSTADASQVMADFNGLVSCPHFTGDAGIGTPSPLRRLHIFESAGSVEFVQELGGVVANGGKWNWVVDGGSSSQPSQYYLRRLNDDGASGSAPFLLITGGAAPNQVVLQPNGGNVGIGTNTPSYPLYVNGTIYATGGAGALSDVRHKHDVKALPNGALALVDRLRPVSYLWNEARDDGMRGRQIGFTAQDVEKVIPTVVLTQADENRTKALKYDQLIPILTKAIQEQQAEIRRMKARLDKLSRQRE